MGELYAQFGMFMLLVAVVSVYKYGRNTQSLLWRRTFIVSSIVVVLMIALDIKFDITPASEIEKNNRPQPKVEQAAEKTKPEVKRPEKSMMVASKYAIEKITKHYVTDSWILEYGEHINPDGTISTHGACEIDSDGRKRLYWLTFDATGEKVLRLKIDSDLIYSIDGK